MLCFLIMNSGIDSLHKILKDKTRRRIILLLREKESLSYTDLMNALEITNTGKMNYHLKVLGDLLSKGENGQYALTEKGMLASQLLIEFPEKTVKQLRLGISDTLLIGLAGFLLALINPFIWGTVIGGILILGSLLVPIYAIFVPSAVMWRLTTTRTKAHDFYELFKPPIIPAFICTLIFILLVVFSFLNPDFRLPLLRTDHSYVGFTAFGLLFLGFAPFIGVAVIEALYRITQSR
jgi:DNA-binding transcriptional ArsR family regulator